MHEERLGKLSLIPLSYRHEMKDLLFLHGCAFGKYNLDFSDFLQKKKYMSTRSSPYSFLIPKCRTKKFQRSFFVRDARLWNTLPSSTQSQKSYENCKSILRKYYVETTREIHLMPLIIELGSRHALDVGTLRTY